MTAHPEFDAVLRTLAAAGIGLQVNAAGKLVARAAPGALAPRMRQLIAQHRDALVAALAPGAPARPAPGRVVAIRPGGAAAPLFLVHAGRGDIDYARRLAQVLDAAVPVYALLPPGLVEGEACPDSVGALAALYRAAIRAVQPGGPYRIGGWSAGGTIAFELARQLAADGAMPAYVALFDTRADHGHGAGEGDEEDGDGDETGENGEDGAGPRARAAQAAALRAWLPAPLPAGLAGVLDTLQAQADPAGMLDACARAGALPGGASSALLQRHLAVWYGLRRAVRRYVPVPVAFPVHLFVAAGEARADATLGWTARGVAVTPIATGGDHDGMLAPPHLAGLGQRLSAGLLGTAGPLIEPI